ncbi:hypothetical protein NBZ79_19335 [Sneathiella marina]|uniref:Polymerase n=1 Tax=Sneathiella marina TaxID=2950108 RepID=A0ABY4W6G7_9PROT|nr:hypothetical protein [Sneathiella marina]USG61315.1 hypothetical protein NBZ79_19335 [Sneathiella marina]
MLISWANETTAHPVGIALVALCAIATIMLRRNYAIIPLLIMIMAIPSAQRIVIATIDFSFIRIVIIAAIIRVMFRREYLGFTMKAPDVYILVSMIWGIFAYGILYGNVGAFVFRIGYMLDAAGAYFLGRIFIRTVADLRRNILFIGFASIPMFIVFSVERVTGRNLFAEFGGVPKYTAIRDGRLRCQGPFSHPIMAGVFWAVILPWFGAFWMNKQIPRILLIIFGICCLGILLNTASSTPVMSVFFGCLAMAMYVFRSVMSYVRWGILLILLALHMVMKAPVWHLISRIDISGGSTGWHRYNLIEKFIDNFNEWWLVGVRSTAHWDYGLQDVTNQFILEAVRGGLLSFVLFILFIYSIFKIIGRGIKASETNGDRWVLWGAGSVLFVHCMSFLAVSYFGQMLNAFYLFLGGSVSLAVTIIANARKNAMERARNLNETTGDQQPTHQLAPPIRNRSS